MKEKSFKIKYSKNSRFGSVELKIERNPEKALIDFHPFFEEYFGERDYRYAGPGKNRFSENNDISEVNFSLSELWETFMGRYLPNEIVDFFKTNTSQNKDLDKFLGDIESFEDMYKVALPILSDNYNPPSIPRMRIFPLNFGLEEINDLIKLNIHDRPKFSSINGYAKHIGRPDTKYNRDKLSIPIYFENFPYRSTDKRSIRKLQLSLLEKDPTVILPLTNRGRGIRNLLDPFSFIKKYDLSTDHLDIRRKRASQSL